MKKLALLLAVFGLSAMSCTGMNIISIYGPTPTHPAQEYANPIPPYYRGGLLYHKNTVAGQIGQNASAERSGKSCSYSFLWLFAWGDSSIETAKKKGNITKVHSVDHEILGILAALYHRHCTVLTGS